MNNYPIYSEEYAAMYPKTQSIVQPSLTQSNRSLVNSYDGFIRGNLFANHYFPYTSNEPFNVTPQNERESMLNKYREYDFALIDLGMYLDVHPNDTDMIRMYNQYLKMAEQTKKEYETRFGPLAHDGEGLNTTPWSYLNTPWPWEAQ